MIPRRIMQWGFMLVTLIGAYSPGRSDPQLDEFGILLEPRVVLGAVLCGVAVLTFVARPQRIGATTSQWMWYFGFAAVHILVLASALWSSTPWMLDQQVKDLLLLLVFMFTYVQLFGREPEYAVQTLFASSIALSVPFLALMLSAAGSGEWSGAGGIGMARLFGLATIAIVYDHLRTGRRYGLLLLPALAAGIMVSGSRAALLALIVALAFLFLRRKRVQNGRRGSWTVRVVAAALALIGTVAFFLTPLGLGIIEGFLVSNLTPASRELGAPEAIYLADRDVIFKHAFSTAVQHPAAGLGVGSYRGPFGEEYPHNLLLTYAVDAGIVAVGLLLAFIVHFGWRSLRARADWSVGAATAGMFLLVASLFAGSYYDARVFWFMSFALTAAGAVQWAGVRLPTGPVALFQLRAGAVPGAARGNS